jgi:hypothetical protein
MSRSIFAVIVLVALATAALGTEPKPKSGFRERVRAPQNIGFATSASSDGQVVTILFDNLYVEVNPPRRGATAAYGQTAVDTKLFTLHLPYSSDESCVKMTVDVRGFRSTSPGAAARLVVCAGDATQVVDLSPDKATRLKGTVKKTICEEQPDLSSDDFEDRVEFQLQKLAARPICQITLVLIVEQDTDSEDSGGALLAVDSLNVSIAEPAKAR